MKSWPFIITECRQVLGSELHYQAMVYHCLRHHGEVPSKQIGMNVKMRVMNPKSKLFKELDFKKHINFRGGFEPIPDVSLFSPRVEGDWRRRNREVTLGSLLLAIEVKASEREHTRLRSSEIQFDIKKLAAHRFEARERGSDFYPLMMVVDTAPVETERIKDDSIIKILEFAEQHEVGVLYLSPFRSQEFLPPVSRT